MSRWVVMAAITSAAVATGPVSELKSDEFKSVVESAAEELGKFTWQVVSNAGQGLSVQIRQVSGKPAITCAEKIEEMLESELKRLGFNVAPNAAVTVDVDVCLDQRPHRKPHLAKGGKRAAVALFRFTFRADGKTKEWETHEFDEGFLAALFGLTVALPTPKDDMRRADERLDAILQAEKKGCVVDPLIVRSSQKSPYDVQIRVGNEPLPISKKNGLASVSLKDGQRFAVRVISRDKKYAVAVHLTLDGRSVFEYRKDGEPDYSIITVEKDSSADIPGWYYAQDDVRHFQAKPAGQSNPPPGTLTLVFRAAWKKGDPPPDDEPDASTLGSGKRTGIGPAVSGGKFELRSDMEWQLGIIRDAVTVRY